MPTISADAKGVARAIRTLRRGGLVVFPTETFYGLAVDPWNETALSRLLERKQRSPDHPLPLILADRDQLSRLVDRVSPEATALMDRFWPGPLTLVLPARPGLPGALISERGVGVRVSPHPIARALAAGLGSPLVATSANRRGLPPPLSVTEAHRNLGPVDLTLNGGPTTGGAPSTVVAFSASGEMEVLRQGACDVGQR
ncbi:MAG: L-threonylcarbamoyladenylate synthase [bacterium]